MKENIKEEISRIKELMFEKNIIVEQSTTGCTQGNCENGEGTFIAANGDKSVGTFKDKVFVKGKKTFADGSKQERNYDDDGFGTIIYTNPSGWVSPSIPYQKYQSGWLMTISQGDRKVGDTIYSQLDTFKPEQQCICADTIEGQTPNVQLSSQKTVAFVELSKGGSLESFYQFYSSGRIINFQGGTELKRGTYSCNGSKIKITYEDKTEEVLGGSEGGSQDQKQDSTKKDDSSKKSTGSYKYCPDFPFTKFCSNKAVIGKVQECLGGLKTDGFFGPKTEAKLKEKGYEIEITKEVYDKIMADCGKETPKEEPKKEGEVDVNPYADWVSGEEESD